MNCYCGNNLTSPVERETQKCDTCWQEWVDAVAQAAINGALSVSTDIQKRDIVLHVAVQCHKAKGGRW